MRHLSPRPDADGHHRRALASTGTPAWAGAWLCAGALTGVLPGAGHAAQPAPTVAQVQGSVEQGRRWLLLRHETGCVLCHEVPGIAQGGQIGPPLVGLASRYTAEELSARIADARQFNPQTIMPPYRSTAGLQHVAPAFQGKPVLTQQALADIVSYLLARPDAVAPSPPAPLPPPPSPTSPPRP
jgi:sulfur-oxidizing protein SoxX